ncbi:MAG TPA: calcium:proton antiporter [Casimicrobiaceae bacterium]|nr:calcium:proton antiporter [Casimicrobiaceae bacterium]
MTSSRSAAKPAALVVRAALRFIFVFGTAGLFLLFDHQLLSPSLSPAISIAVFLWLFAAVVIGALTVVANADELAVMLGEPYGTLILTLSVGSIEIMTIGTVMLTGEANPALARDTMFSVVMIVMNGLTGLALLLGGLRYREQGYNFPGVTAYLSLIVVLSTLGMILPNYTTTTLGPTLSRGQQSFLIAMCLSLYAVFLIIQTTRHRSYFAEVLPAPEPLQPLSHGAWKRMTVARHTAMMIVFLGATVLLAEKLAVTLNTGLETFGLPSALGALLVAILVLVPEGVGAIEAALANQVQRSMNILLGSALATLAMTIPAVIIVAMVGRTTLELGLSPGDQVMLVLTLLTSMLTFGGGRTNVLQGTVHLGLFLAYLLLIFIP